MCYFPANIVFLKHEENELFILEERKIKYMNNPHLNNSWCFYSPELEQIVVQLYMCVCLFVCVCTCVCVCECATQHRKSMVQIGAFFIIYSKYEEVSNFR